MRCSTTFAMVAAAAAAIIAVPLLSAVPASAINGGHDSAQAYGFLGSLQRLESPREDLHVCGVSLLTPTIALTAGHCTRSGADEIDRPTSGHPKNWKVRFGSTQVDSGGQLVDVEQFTQLNNRYFENDLALLKLAEPVTGPTIPIATEAPKPGDDVRILGWGMTCGELTDECLPKHLQEADTEVQDPSLCEIDNEDFCVGAPDGSVSPSNMDSGGPAIVQRDGHWELFATVEGGGDYQPGYYTNVLAHRDWIDGLTSGTVPFPEDTPFTTDALSGTVRFGGCTGAVFRTPAARPDDPALMLTNGHCTDPRPKPNDAIVDEPTDDVIQVLDEHGDTAVRSHSIELAYATMTGTDVAVYRLDTSYDELEAAGITVRSVSNELPTVGQDVELLAGGTGVALSCTISAVVPTLREGGYEMHGSLRYADGQDCSDPDTGAAHGDSGSVLVAAGTDQIVGIHNTSVGTDDDDAHPEACADDNPCEVAVDGKTTVHPDARYGQRTNMLNACFGTESTFTEHAPGCTLTGAGDVGSKPGTKPGAGAKPGTGSGTGHTADPNTPDRQHRRLPVVSG